MKRTNIVLDEDIITKAKSLTGIHTTRELVDHALRELVRHKRQRDILKLRGQIKWEGKEMTNDEIPKYLKNVE